MAQRDLAAIGDHIRIDNPHRAETFIEELYDCCRSPADQLERYPVAAWRRGRVFRKPSHGNYLILYAIGQDRIEVARVFHGARNRPGLLR